MKWLSSPMLFKFSTSLFSKIIIWIFLKWSHSLWPSIRLCPRRERTLWNSSLGYISSVQSNVLCVFVETARSCWPTASEVAASTACTQLQVQNKGILHLGDRTLSQEDLTGRHWSKASCCEPEISACGSQLWLSCLPLPRHCAGPFKHPVSLNPHPTASPWPCWQQPSLSFPLNKETMSQARRWGPPKIELSKIMPQISALYKMLSIETNHESNSKLRFCWR